jgi:hypothetical protein
VQPTRYNRYDTRAGYGYGYDERNYDPRYAYSYR